MLIATPRGSIFFEDASNAANATIVNGGSELGFAPLFAGGGSASAGDATITTTAGAFTHFDSDSSGGNAAFITEAGGLVDISQLSVNGTTAGSIAGAGTYDLGSKQFVVGSNNTSTTVDGIIEDGGVGGGVGASLVKVGTGTLTLSGADTYTGGTTISAGTLQLGDGGVTGSIVGDVVDNGTLAFNFSNPQTFSGLISGTGGVAQVGPGVTTLTAINTYAGPTMIAAGTLMAGTPNSLPGLTAVTVASAGTLDLAGFDQTIGSLAGAGGVALGSATLTTGADNTSTEFSGVISGGGSLDKVGTGTFILSGANTYAGGTTISAGTLQLGDGGATGSIVGDVVDNGALAFDRSDIASFTGVVSGTGSVSQIGTGTTVLTGANIYTGSTTISAGTLQLGDGGTSGGIVGDVVDNGALAFNRSDTVTFPGTISGTGAVNQIGVGTTILTADNTYTGPTTIAAGTLQLGDGGTSGAVTGDIIDNATLVFDRSDTVTIPGDISGTGGVSQIGAGTTILTGANTYLGGTTINAGALELGDDGTSGGLVGDIINNAMLEFDRSDTVTLPGDISGTGSVSQIGDGTTILTGVNTYMGGTTISAGALQLGDGGRSGSIIGNVADNGNLTFDRSDAVTFPGVISGAGSVSQIGSGTTILTGANTYTGGTTISAGTLQLGDGGTSGSIVGDVADNGTLAFDRSDTVTFGGRISGTGAVNQMGGGVTILTADNTYTGLTTISAGTLQLGNGGTSGGVIGNIADDTALVFDRSDTVIIPGTIFSAGAVSQIGSGTTILTADDSYTGGTTISAGTLQLGNGGVSGGVLGDITDNGALVFDRSNTATLPGAISGIGSVSQNGTGTTVLTGANTYAGGTTISAGTLQLGDGGVAGSIVGDVADNGILAFDRSDIVTFPGVISGTGSVSQIGAGTTILSGANTYTGGTTISAGTLQLGDGGTSGAIVGDVADNGTLAFNRNDTVTFAGTISGTGAVSQIGGGTTILAADNTYTGPTTIAAGTLQLGNGGASGVVVGDIVDNAALVFDRSDTATIPGAISGAGMVSQIGGGTTILTADNTYTGGTTISAGTLQLGNGGTSGAIVGDVADNGALAFDRSDTVTFAGAISGVGAVNQIGAGATILNAANPYSGPTTISHGTLVVGDASHPGASIGVGAVEIASAGTLGGFGSVGGSVVNDGAIVVGNALPAFAAGPLATFQIEADLQNNGAIRLASSAIGNTLVVRGNYVGQGGTVEMSTLLNEGGPLANQTTDRLLVYGNANGATEVRVNGTGAGAFTGTGQPNASDGISLIQVAGAASSGTFQLAGGYVTGGTPYQYRLYGFGPGSAIGPADPSQSLVGNANGHWDYRLENVYVEPTGPVPPEPPEPPKPPPHDERLEVAPQVAAYLTAPLVVFNAGMQDLDSLHRRLGEIRDDQQLGRGQPGEVFARAYGGTYDYTSNLSFQNDGYNVEQDYVALQFGANWIAHQDSQQTVRVGLAGTLGRLWFKPEAIDGVSTGLMNTETLAGIATLQRKSGWYIDAILAGSWLDGNVSTADRGRTTKLDGSRFETSIEGGYPIALGRPGLAFEPQVQFVYQRLSFDDKTDVDGIDVAIGAPDQAMARIGARLTQQIAPGSGTLITPYLKMNYLQGIGGGDHAEIGGVVFGTGTYGQAFQVGGGVTGTLGHSFSVFGDMAYQTHVGSGGFGGWSFNGGLRYVF